MKITKSQLKQVIKEEFKQKLNIGEFKPVLSYLYYVKGEHFMKITRSDLKKTYQRRAGKCD